MVILDNIFKLLKEQGKTQVELAQFLGISKNSITEWRHGRNRSYEKYLYQIAAYLGTTPEYLKGETDVKYVNTVNGNNNIVGNNGSVTVAYGGLTEQEQELVELFRALSTINKAKALIYISELDK